MSTMQIMMGIPGSGKSTFIKNHYFPHYQIICADDIRVAISVEYNKGVEPIVQAITKTMCRAHMIQGRNIVIDYCNTQLWNLENWVEIAVEFSYSTSVTCIITDLETCKERRKDQIEKDGDDFVTKMYNQLNLTLRLLKQDDYQLFNYFEVRKGE